MGQSESQSELQHLPEFVRKYYHWENRRLWGAMAALVVLAWYIFITFFGSDPPEYGWAKWGAIIFLVVGFADWFFVRFHCVGEHERAVDWVDGQMKRYGLRPMAPNAQQMDQVLAALAHLLHASPDTDTARARKTEFRQAKGLMELIYGVGNTSSVSELRERFPLNTLKQTDALISTTLSDGVASIPDKAA